MAEGDITYDEYAQMCKDAGIASEDAAEMQVDYRIGLVFTDVMSELEKAVDAYPAFNSAHEGFGILKEEVDELWDEVKVKQGARDINKMRQEAIQVAAMAIRFAVDVCHDDAGQN